MTGILESALWVVEIIVGIGMVIFIHEFGHFLMAKRNGVRVEVFSLGFGPAIFRRRYGETEYRVSWVPLGGYVKMAGEQHSDKEDPQPYELTGKNAWVRLQIFAAGAIMNLILAFPVLILAGLVGKWESAPIVAVPGTAESAAGMRPGDEIQSVDGTPIKSLDEYKMMVIGSDQGRDVPVVVKRDGQEVALTVRAHESPFHAVSPPGTVLVTLDPNGEMARAGARGREKDIPGDKIVKINNEVVYTDAQVAKALEKSAGQSTSVTLMRDGGTRNITITPTKIAGPLHFPKDEKLIKPIVGTVVGGTPAALNGEAGPLKSGDLILEIEGTPITNWDELREKIKPQHGKPTSIVVKRDGQQVTVSVTPGFSREGKGVLGIEEGHSPEVATVTEDSIYYKAGLRSGDTLVRVGTSVDKDVSVSKIFEASSPAPVPQGHWIYSRFNPIGIFLMSTVGFGLIALGPLTWLWLRRMESHRRREAIRYAATFIPALAAVAFWMTQRPDDKTPDVVPLQVDVARDGKVVTLTIDPVPQQQLDVRSLGVLEWGHQFTYRNRSFSEACVYGVKEPWAIIQLTVRLLKKLVTGDESPKGLAGPVGIFTFSYRSAELGAGNLLWMIGLITINLGIFNLLPVPLLDGGHVALLGYEALARRRPSLKFEVIYQWTGLVLLLTLIIFVTWNDIKRMLL